MGKTIAIIGGGKMGEAIAAGWISSAQAPADAIQASDVTIVEPGDQRRAYLEQTYGTPCLAQVAQLASGTAPDVVVFAVKPQVLLGVVRELAELPAFGAGQTRTLFVSIAAGVTTDTLAAILPEGAPLVRVMPNMPLMVGAGASGVCAHAGTDPACAQLVADLFGCLGRAVVVDESDMDAVCALSGSGPAYVAAMIESLRDAAAARGLDVQLAETLALQTVLGTAKLIAETDLSPATAREAVCSPGGTTLAALEAMEQAGFDKVFDAGVEAAIRRSKELAQCSS